MSNTVKLERCPWCWRRNCEASEWEQEHHRHGWLRLCTRCAAKRLRNPYNALLSMRKVGPAEVLRSGSADQR